MKKRSEQEWRALFAQHQASGLSAARFCKQKRLCHKYFSLRKKQLGDTVEAAFVPVVHSITAPAVKTSGMTIHHGRCAVRFDELPTATWLATLVQALS